MLIGGGQYGSITPLYLAAEGSVILKFPNPSLMHALVVLTASYYVFNIQYPAQEKKHIYLKQHCCIMWMQPKKGWQ